MERPAIQVLDALINSNNGSDGSTTTERRNRLIAAFDLLNKDTKISKKAVKRMNCIILTTHIQALLLRSLL